MCLVIFTDQWTNFYPRSLVLIFNNFFTKNDNTQIKPMHVLVCMYVCEFIDNVYDGMSFIL